MNTLGRTRRIRRSIEGALAPLLGVAATGTVLATAVSGWVEIPSGAYAAPVIPSVAGTRQIQRTWPLYSTAATLVSAAGTAVPVASHLGGVACNLAAGTVIRWDPPIAGISPTASVVAMTGGAVSIFPATARVRVIAGYDGIGRGEALAMFKAMAADLPAIIVAWEGSPAARKMGGTDLLVTDRWQIMVACSRHEAFETAQAEALDVLDAASALLCCGDEGDRHVYSAPPAAIVSRQLISATSDDVVLALTLETFSPVQRVDLAATRHPLAWHHTRAQLLTGGDTDTFPAVDATADMLCGAFSSAFGASFDAGPS